MAHSHTRLYFHCIFSTKERQPLIEPSFEIRLYEYVHGIARNHKAFIHAIGGMSNHVHLLLETKADVTLAETMRAIKAVSSKWIHETFPEHRRFAWQTGYGGFTVSASAMEDVKAYIHHQKEHHRTRTFEEEYVAFLKRHGVEYDERFVFD